LSHNKVHFEPHGFHTAVFPMVARTSHWCLVLFSNW
jgi:hypothetical protein